ncbi:hypothetical protein BOX15_Mlig031230g2, partial [Macrostomum lignano]
HCSSERIVMSGEEQAPLTGDAAAAAPADTAAPAPAAGAAAGSGTGPSGTSPAPATAQRANSDVRSLMIFQAILYLNKYYVGLFCLFQILIFAWKGENLPFANGILASEVILVFVICGLDLARIGLSMHGNLAENRVSLALGIGFAVPPIIGSIYLILWQSYTLTAELVTCSVALAFHGVGILLAIATLATIR